MLYGAHTMVYTIRSNIAIIAHAFRCTHGEQPAAPSFDMGSLQEFT